MVSIANIEGYVKKPYANKRNSVAHDSTFRIKQGIWVYFILLIFEGALRKWFLPFLATPLLIVRDPVAIWLLIAAWRRGILKFDIYLVGIFIIGIISIFTAVFFGHGNLLVAIYGARILLFHFPVIYIIGNVFTKSDLINIGKFTLYISVIMTVLLILQFYSPQSAWVNRGVGGDLKGAGYDGAMGYSRPPGTFSFTTGTTMFYSFVAPFIFYFWLYPKHINKLILILATLCLLIAIPLSISRGLFFQVALTAIFTFIGTVRKPEYFGKLLLAVIGIVLAVLILSQTAMFNTAFSAFSSRFETASGIEGGVKGTLIDRFILGTFGYGPSIYEQHYFGVGIGMGTNVGSQLLTGTTTFLVAEGELARELGELGPLIGITLILLRIGFAVKLFLGSYKKLILGDLFPWLLLSYGFLDVAEGGWAQPTGLGFCVIIGGLLFAAVNTNTLKNKILYS